MTKEFDITTCSLSCDLCDANTTKIQESAINLLNTLEDPMYRGVISMTNKNFKEKNYSVLKEMLEILKNNPPCPGCNIRKECPINHCANGKEIDNCSECEFLDTEGGICKAPPEPSNLPFLPPAPIFFNGLAQRYRKWNVKNLKAIAEKKKKDVDENIYKMIKAGKTSRDLIDFSVNLFKL